MKNNVIYAYKKKSSNKIVYVGQSQQLEIRHKQHTEYDPYNPNNREYNYPLSRGIRKYGKEEYELIILEDNIPKDQLNQREKYWIEYYNTYWEGYNQTIGGTWPTQPTYSENKIDTVINMLQDESFSYQDIINKTGISLTHVYNINIGTRRKRDNLIYPIRSPNIKGTKGIKLTPEENIKIHDLILHTEKNFAEIGKIFGVAKETIGDINRGKTKAYRLNEYIYPLRSDSLSKSIGKSKLDNKQVEEIQILLLDTNLSFEKIGEKYGVGLSTISRINNGKTKKYYSNELQYPLRNTTLNK